MIAQLIAWASGGAAKWAVIALALAGWTLFNRVDAARVARADCQLRHAEASLAAEKDRAARADQITQNARDRADEAQAAIAELESARDEILDSGCDMSDDLRDRLRDLN